MSAQIVVFGSDQRFNIDFAVTRIGCGGECDIRIGDHDLPNTFVTLEFRAGEFLLHNRCQVPILLNGKQLSAGTSGPVVHGTQVELADGVAFLLDIDGTAAPSLAHAPGSRTTMPDEYSEINRDESETSEAIAASSAPTTLDEKTILQLAIIAVCICIIVAMIGYKLWEVNHPPEQTVSAVNISDLFDLNPNETQRRIISQIQHAELLGFQGDEAGSLNMWLRLRDEIDWNKDNEASKFSDAAQELIKSRIGNSW